VHSSGGRLVIVASSIHYLFALLFFFFSSRRRHTRFKCDWSSDVCSSDLVDAGDLEHLHQPLALRARRQRLHDLHGRGGAAAGRRSEERRVGKECRWRWRGEEGKKRRRILAKYAWQNACERLVSVWVGTEQ